MSEGETDERREAALAVVAAYRAAHPADARTDSELLTAPYGGYELADMDFAHRAMEQRFGQDEARTEAHEKHRAERLRRLSAGRKGLDAAASAGASESQQEPAVPEQS